MFRVRIHDVLVISNPLIFIATVVCKIWLQISLILVCMPLCKVTLPLLASRGEVSPTCKPGITSWSAVTNWMWWKWCHVTSEGRSQETSQCVLWISWNAVLRLPCCEGLLVIDHGSCCYPLNSALSWLQCEGEPRPEPRGQPAESWETRNHFFKPLS